MIRSARTAVALAAFAASALALVGCAPSSGVESVTGVPITPAPDYDPLASGENSDIPPTFEWSGASKLRMNMLNNRPLCGAGDPTLEVVSANEVRIQFVIERPNEMCIDMLFPVSYEFELPASATGRPLEISVRYERTETVDTATLGEGTPQE